MSSKAITIYTPAGTEPHISAQDDAFIYDSLLDGRSGILGRLTCTLTGSGSVRLSGGGAVNKGYILRVPEGETCDLTLSNGVQGMGRHDIVAAQFTKGDGAKADTHEFVVVEGAPASDPADPVMITSSLLNSGDVNQTALFRIIRSGLDAAVIEPIAGNAAAAPLVTAAESCTGNAASATVAASCTGNAASATVAASCTGNAASATALAAPVTMTLSGDVSGSASFNGSKSFSVNTSAKSINGHTIYIQEKEPTSPTTGDIWLW